MSEAKICSLPHPKIEGVVCTKPEGHQGRHGRQELPMRCIMWDKHLAVAAARDAK